MRRDFESGGGRSSDFAEDLAVKIDAGPGLDLIDHKPHAGSSGEARRPMKPSRIAAGRRVIFPGAAEANSVRQKMVLANWPARRGLPMKREKATGRMPLSLVLRSL